MNGSYSQQRRRTTQLNTPSILLSDYENNELYGLLGRKCVTLATGVVQVHKAQNSHWQKIHTGACCFVKDSNKRSYYFRVYNIKGGHMVFEQEFYNQFKYNTPKPHFLTFDADRFRAGLNFANDKEAFSFKQILDDKIRQKQDKKQARMNSMREPSRYNSQGGYPPQPQQHAPVQQPPQQVQYQHSSSAQEVKLTSKADDKKSKKKKKSKLSKSDIGHPSGFQHVGHVGWDPNRGFDMNNIDSDLRQLFGEAGITEKDMEDQDKRQFIYDFIEKQGGLEAVRKDTQRRSRNNRNAPPPPPPNRSSQPPPPPPSRGGPPPPPPQRGLSTSRAPPPPQRQHTGRGAVPPPPSRNTPPSIPSVSPPPSYSSSPHMAPAGAPPPPPPPPPPPSMSAGAPPPPAPAANSNLLSQIQQGTQLKAASERQLPAEAAPSSVSGRDALLNAIRRGKELKAVSNEPAADKPSPAPAGGGESLASALAWALQKRETAIQPDSGSDESEEDDDEEWSD